MSAARIVVLLLVLGSFVHAAEGAAARGEAIFERAVAALETEYHPRYASYAVRVSFVNGTRAGGATWDTREDVTDAAIIPDIFSREEHRSPSVPHGFNTVFNVSLPTAAQGYFGVPRQYVTAPVYQSGPPSSWQSGDPVGPVAFAVDQNFGLTPPRAYAVMHDVDAFAAAAKGFAVIGHTGARAPRYRVTLVDVDGALDHLALSPLRDPYHNRLRELWVDDGTAVVREAIVQGVGDRAPLDRVRWDVTFTQKDGATYVAEERAVAPLDYGRRGLLTAVRISFDELTLSEHFPFDATFGISTPIQMLHDP